MATIGIPEYKNIKMIKSFPAELDKLLKGYGCEKKFRIWFLDALGKLNDTGYPYHEHPRDFESLGQGLFALTYRNREKNIRIIYHVEKNGIIKLLLSVFDEKTTHADYNFYINQAKTRLKRERTGIEI